MLFSLTKKDYAIFKQYCREAIAAFHLNDWDVEFAFEEIECGSRGDRLAECGHSSGAAKIAEITLNTWWCRKPTERRLKGTAYHEVLHLLMADVFSISMDIDLGYTQKRECLDGAIHACINRLLPVLLNCNVASEDGNGHKQQKKKEPK